MLTWRWLACALCMVLAVSGAQAQPLGPSVGSLDQDRTTLSNFLEGIDNALNTTLGGWDATSSQDICTWPGVICNCSQLAAAYTDSCFNITAGVAGPRVIGLDLAGEGPYAVQPMQGTITDSIGDLTVLVYLDVGQNELRGTLPTSLSSIQTLRWLQLANNQLTGNLPEPLGRLPGLQLAALDGNNFTGPIPDSWCDSPAQFRVEENPLLCGAVSCPSKLRSLDGTYLFRRGQTGVGGGCSTSPPYCNLNVGCRVMAPRFWTSRTVITFNFTEAFDPVTGPVRYQWCLGTSPGTDDALPLRDVVPRFNTTNFNTPWGSELVRMSPVAFNMSSVSLTEGGSYYPTVLAWNNAGPPLYTAYTAQASVAVDTTGPTSGQVFNTINYTQSITTSSNRVLEASWSGFTDAQSGISGYMVQFFQQAANRSLPSFNVTPAMDAGLLTQVSVAVNTTAGRAYFARVTAINGAGLRTSVNGIPIRARKDKGVFIPAGLTALAAVLSGVGCLVIGTVAAYMWLAHERRQQDKKREQQDQETQQLRLLMSALKDNNNAMGPTGTGRQSSLTVHQKVASGPEETSGGWALVITDVESSSDISRKDPVAFGKIQAAHDMVMREGLSKYDGYEIITEGDSFHIAFTNVFSAVAFCLDVQDRLMDINWDARILRLDECKATCDEQGQLMFIGPRVRMGVHWARAGIVVKDHEHTKHKHFDGPSYETAAAIGETASGGQIVMSRDALLELVTDMGRAHFPVIQCLGMYEVNNINVWLYEVKEHAARPLHRTFPELRKCQKIFPEEGYRLPMNVGKTIAPCPAPEDDMGTLSFVSSMYGMPSGQNLTTQLPESLYRHLMDSFSSQAQQFRGYMFNWNTLSAKEGQFMVAFPTTADAVKFCHAIQVHLMYAKYPQDAATYISAPATGPDGKWVFHGPRVGLAVHRGCDYTVTCLEKESDRCPNSVIQYSGDTLHKTQLLCNITRGGQVVLSDVAWQAVKADIAAHCTSHMVIHLGRHQLCPEWPEPQHLYEVMPTVLAERKFGKPRTLRRVEMGYREAPDIANPMVIVFVKVQKPHAVEEARMVKEQVDKRDRHLISAYVEALHIHNTLLRGLLKAHGGYECKEPEPGKFTLAFHDLWSAIRWGTQFQQDLMYSDWPPRLLEMEECCERWDLDGQLVWRGLRVKIGMSWGKANTKKPLNTGHADYFGILPNRAARVMAGAHAGQVLIEFTSESEAPSVLKDVRNSVSIMAKFRNPETGELLVHPPADVPDHFHNVSEGNIIRCSGTDPATGAAVPMDEVVIEERGVFLLKGLDGNRIHECIAPKLRNRTFPPLPLQPAMEVKEAKGKDKGAAAAASGGSATQKARQDPNGAGVMTSASSLNSFSLANWGLGLGRLGSHTSKQKGLGRASQVLHSRQPQELEHSSNQVSMVAGGSAAVKAEGSEPGTPQSGQIQASYGVADGSPQARQLAAVQRAHSASLEAQGRQGSPSPLSNFWGLRHQSLMGQQAPGPELGLPTVRTQHLQPAGSMDTSSWGGSSLPSPESTPRDMALVGPGGLSPRIAAGGMPASGFAGLASAEESQQTSIWSRALGWLPGRANRAASYTPEEVSSMASTPRQAAHLSDGSAPEVAPAMYSQMSATGVQLPPPAQQLMQQQQLLPAAGGRDAHLPSTTGALPPAEAASAGSPTARPPCSSPGGRRSFTRCASPLAPPSGTVRTASNSSLLAQGSHPSRLGLLPGLQEAGSTAAAPVSSSDATHSSTAADSPVVDASRPPSASAQTVVNTSQGTLRAAAAMEQITPEGSETGLEGAGSPGHTSDQSAAATAPAAPAVTPVVACAGTQVVVRQQQRSPPPSSEQQQTHSSVKAALTSKSSRKLLDPLRLRAGSSGGGHHNAAAAAAPSEPVEALGPPGHVEEQWTAAQYRDVVRKLALERQSGYGTIHRVVQHEDMEKWRPQVVDRILHKAISCYEKLDHVPAGGAPVECAAQIGLPAPGVSATQGPLGTPSKVSSPASSPPVPLQQQQQQQQQSQPGPATTDSSNSSSLQRPGAPPRSPATATTPPVLPGLMLCEPGGVTCAKASAQLSRRSSSRLSQVSSGHSSEASTPRNSLECSSTAAEPLAVAAAALAVGASSAGSCSAPGSPEGLHRSAGGANSSLADAGPHQQQQQHQLPPPVRGLPGLGPEGTAGEAHLKARARAATAAPGSSTASSTPGHSPSSAGSYTPATAGPGTFGSTTAHAEGAASGCRPEGGGVTAEMEAGSVGVVPAAAQSPGRRRGIPCDRVGSNRALQGIPEAAGHEEVSPRSSQH